VCCDEVTRLFTLLGDGKIDSHQNWKGRFKDNSDKMRTGSIYDVVDVLKNLTALSKSKSLSFREKRMLDRAKFLVVSEISEVTTEPTAVIEEKVDRALDRCLQARQRAAAPASRPANGGNKVVIKVPPPAAAPPRRAVRAS
jgi:CarD family transcriptional regulator